MGTIHEMPGRYSDRERDFDEQLRRTRDELAAEFDRKPDLRARFAANDRYGDDSECTDELTPRIGLFGFTVMALVAALIGAWLAIGHS